MKRQRLVLDTGVVLELLKQQYGSTTPPGLHELRSGPYDFALPSIVVGEVLAGCPASTRSDLAALLDDTYEILSCDYETARIAANIHSRAIRSRKKGITRQCVKADAFIVGCAVAWRCDGIVYLDADICDMAAWLTPPLTALALSSFVGPQGHLPLG